MTWNQQYLILMKLKKTMKLSRLDENIFSKFVSWKIFLLTVVKMMLVKPILIYTLI